MTEAQLIRHACEGDGPAVRALYERYAPRVYAVVRRIAGEDDLAQDYAQEAWIRAIRALPTFRGDARFSTWLHRIAVNSALQALRRNDTRTKREAPMPEAVAVHPKEGDVLLNFDHVDIESRNDLIFVIHQKPLDVVHLYGRRNHLLPKRLDTQDGIVYARKLLFRCPVIRTTHPGVNLMDQGFHCFRFHTVNSGQYGQVQVGLIPFIMDQWHGRPRGGLL